MKPLLLATALLAATAAPAMVPAQPSPPSLALPLACEPGKTCFIQSYMDHDPGPGSKDFRCGARTYDAHSGVDIRIQGFKAMAAGVPVLAAAPGKVLRLRDGVEDMSIRDRPGGITNNQDCGNAVIIDHGGGWTTQYCHMRKGSVRVKAGDVVKTGDPIGLVGLSGNTEFPHLHVTVYEGKTVVDPFAYGEAPGACSGGRSLWNAATTAKLAYRDSEVINTGFSLNVVDQPAIEAGTVPAATREGDALIAYVRVIGLKAGDVPTLTLTGPDGQQIAQTPPAAVPRDQAVRVTFVGRKRHPGDWKPGTYQAVYAIRRNGAVALERRFELKL